LRIKHILLATFFIGFINVINAQSEKVFSISGQVKIASENGESKPTSACLRIESIKKETCTKERGTFRIDSVKYGDYRLEVVGFGCNPFDTIITVSGEINKMEVILFAKCEINRNTAINDIKLHKPRLLIIGGIAPTYIQNRELFENKYRIKYDDLGDIPPPRECIEQYNYQVFEYLDKKFGQAWKDEVNENVVGIGKWK
jgi:hypothetical protein